MALGQRQLVVVLLLLLVVSTTAVRMSRTLKTSVTDQVSLPNFHSQDVEQREKDDGVLKVLERRMTIELADYPGTGANRNHDPRTPGGV